MNAWQLAAIIAPASIVAAVLVLRRITIAWDKRHPVEETIEIDDRHSVTTTTDPTRTAAKFAWTNTVGPTVRCKGSGKRGIITHELYVQCIYCRAAWQMNWGTKMREHEREARGKERDG